METINNFFDFISRYFFALNPIWPYLITFLSGSLAGIVTFASDFTDKPKVLIKSGWCRAYSLFNGAMATLIFIILDALNIKIMTLSFSNDRILLSALVGLMWYNILSSSILSTNESDIETSKSLTNIFLRTKKYFYHHYSMNQMTILRPIVWDIVKGIDDEEFYEFTIKCVFLARGISADKGDSLGNIYRQYKESSANVSDYKTSISIDIAKIVGVNLLRQVALEIKEEPRIGSNLTSLECKLERLKSNDLGGKHA
jgi:hypothetical protein